MCFSIVKKPGVYFDFFRFAIIYLTEDEAIKKERREIKVTPSISQVKLQQMRHQGFVVYLTYVLFL